MVFILWYFTVWYPNTTSGCAAALPSPKDGKAELQQHKDHERTTHFVYSKPGIPVAGAG
jgi:hypothetical protein